MMLYVVILDASCTLKELYLKEILEVIVAEVLSKKRV
jgi:hypothetical protein